MIPGSFRSVRGGISSPSDNVTGLIYLRYRSVLVNCIEYSSVYNTMPTQKTVREVCTAVCVG